MKIFYEPIKGKAIPDGKVEEEFKHILNSYSDNLLFAYSTENIFARIRLGIIRGEVREKVLFYFKGQRLDVNEYGKVTPWPKGFCDVNVKFCQSILEEVMDKYRNNSYGIE